MSLIPCAEEGCGATASSVGDLYGLNGVTDDGDVTVWYLDYVCVAGHRYMLEVFEDGRD